MRLVIQIPAFNEEKTIARTLADLPRQIDGVTSIETLVIDDGSTDGTIEAARRGGATHVLPLRSHRGLATAFVAGLNRALQLGADIVVNTDADNQYLGADIVKVVGPIVRGEADVVIGDRNVAASPYMSGFKKLLQRIGSGAVGMVAGVKVGDATSGLRAFSREAAYQINVFNPFTYTLETIIQAGNRNLAIQSVKVGTNAPTRPSRLYRGIGSYVRKSVVTMFRVYTLYKPLKTFTLFALLFLLAGLGVGGRFLVLYARGAGGGHVQSLILAAVFLIVGVVTGLIGLVADLISVNRRLSEEILVRLKKVESASLTKRERNRTRVAPEKGAEPTASESPEAAGGTEWVWLLDEAALAETAEVPAPARSQTSGSAMKKKRRRRGPRPEKHGGEPKPRHR